MGLKWKQRRKTTLATYYVVNWSDSCDSETPIATARTSSLAAEGYIFYTYD